MTAARQSTHPSSSQFTWPERGNAYGTAIRFQNNANYSIQLAEVLDSECRRHRVRICPINWMHWTHHGGRPQRKCVLLLELWEVKSGEGNLRLQSHFFRGVIDLSGSDKSWNWGGACFFACSSLPPSLTKADIPVLAPHVRSKIKYHTEMCYIFPQLC